MAKKEPGPEDGALLVTDGSTVSPTAGGASTPSTVLAAPTSASSQGQVSETKDLVGEIKDSSSLGGADPV